MKDNSYDVPAMKFYIVLPSSYSRESYDGQLVDETINENQVIPFENVDGLSVKEILEIFQISSFNLISAVGYHDQRNRKQLQILFGLNLRNKDVKERINMRIDKVFEEGLIANKYRIKTQKEHMRVF